jgi:hypothetical protein
LLGQIVEAGGDVLMDRAEGPFIDLQGVPHEWLGFGKFTYRVETIIFTVNNGEHECDREKDVNQHPAHFDEVISG